MASDPGTQRWRTLVLVYPVMNARIGSGLTKRRAQRVMGRDERAAVEAVVERLPATILEWSEGAATLDPLDIVEVRRPIGSMSKVDKDRWWVGPREVRPELMDVAATGARYDSVFVLWPGDPSVPQCGWGCSVGPSEATFGAGFSSISTDHWRTLATDPDPEQGYVHEWLHQVEAVYRGLGLTEDELPSLHAGPFLSTRPDSEPPYGATYDAYHEGTAGRPAARTWAPWYRDWMTGRLRPVGEAAAAAGTADGAVRDGTADAARAGTAGTADGVEATAATAEALVSGKAAGQRPIGLTPERWALRALRDTREHA
jgi:hypothetical protein